jgi:NADH-quinone oxidoreductase subunit A
MNEGYLNNYLIILYFIGGGLLFSLLGIVASKILSPNKPNEEKNESYESGETPLRDSRVQFNPAYFIIGLIFLLFEVEIVFLFPWALILDNEILLELTEGKWSWIAFSEMFVFLFILVLGLAFVWKKGFLNWPESKVSKSNYESPIPNELYDKLNKKYS